MDLTPEDILAVRVRIEELRGTTASFDIAVWGGLDSGQLGATLAAYHDAWATWLIGSPKSRLGWHEPVHARVDEVSP